MTDASRDSGAIPPLSLRAQRQLRRAEAWLARGEFKAAEDALGAARDEAPEHPDVLLAGAMALHGQRRFAEAAAALRRVLAVRPDEAGVLNKLGGALGEAGDMPAAADAFEAAAAAAPGHAAYWMNLARARDAAEQVEAALAALDHVLALAPANREARMLHAHLEGIAGHLDTAVAELRALLADDPTDTEAWVDLIGLKYAPLDAQDVTRLRALYADAALPDTQRIPIGFALGQALETAGNYADAFAVLQSVNAAKRKQVAWDADDFSRVTSAQLEAYRQPLAAATDPDLGSDIVFFLGMPRSGSTVAEQILFAHSGVDSAGEIDDLHQVLQAECERRGCSESEWAPQASAADWQRLGEAYLARVQRYRHGGRLLTDKSLEKWRLAGVVHAMLPGARLVHCQRDAVETCWSCFKHDFTVGHWYSYDLRELGQAWRDHHRAMLFWERRLPGVIHHHDHAALLAEPEGTIRKLLAYCGLDWEAGCLEFQRAQRSVRTLSVGQVRQPLRRGADRLAENYGSRLDPLRAALHVAASGVARKQHDS